MQIRLTVVDPLGPPPGAQSRAAACDVLVTAPAGTALAAVASALAASVAGEAGAAERGREAGAGPVVLYAGAERLDAQRCTLGEPPLLDGAVLSLGAPAEPEAHPELDDAPTQLHVVAGPDAGGVHLLHGGQITVGRSADADVPLDDPDVSRVHCAVTVAPDGRVSVADLQSTNGTELDGERVGSRPVRLTPGALLRIGESALRLAPAGGPGARVTTAPDGEGHVRVPSPAGRGPGGGTGPGGGPAAGPAPSAPAAGAGAERTAFGHGSATWMPTGAQHGPEARGQEAGAPGVPPARSQAAGTGDHGGHGPGDAAAGGGPYAPDAGADTHGGRHGTGGPTTRGTGTWDGAGAFASGDSAGRPARPADEARLPDGAAEAGGAVDAGGRKGTPLRGTDVPQGLRRRGGLGAWARRLAGGRGEQAAARDPYEGTEDGGPAHAASPRYTRTRLPETWPDPAALLLTALGPGPRLWERGPGHAEALTVRLGTADRPALDGSGLLPVVPVTADLREVGALGLAGPRARLSGLARAVVAQLAALHSPDTVEIVLIASERTRALRERTAEWSWLGWLPHVRPGHGQDCRLLLAYDAEQAAARTDELLRRLDDHLADTRGPAASGTGAGTGGPTAAGGPGPAHPAHTPHGSPAEPSYEPPPAVPAAAQPPRRPSWARDAEADARAFAGPYTVVVVDGDPGGPALRGAVARLAQEGPRAGIHVVCLAEAAPASPASPVTETYEAACAASPVFRACGAVALLSGDVATALRLMRVAHAGTEARRPGAAAGAGAPRGAAAHPPAGTAGRPDAARPAADPRPGEHPDAAAPGDRLPHPSAPGAARHGSPDRPAAVPATADGSTHRLAAAQVHAHAPAPASGRPQASPIAPGTVAVVDAVSLAWAERFARAMAPLRTDTAGAGPQARVSAPLPQSARLLDELGLARATPASLLARWADAADDTAALGGRAMAVLGAGPRGPVCADLVADGPHLLIEGPAGSGRSELLRSVVASLAAAERPDRLGVVLIDGRDDAGTGAHGEGLRVCTDVPHVTTHLTANDPVRMRELAQSLSAELKRRAELLGRTDFTEWHTQREVSGRIVAQRTPAGRGPGGSGAGDLESPPTATLRLRHPSAARRTEEAPPLARLVVVVDDLDALVSPALGSPGRPAAGSVMRALEAVAREGERLGVHLVAATGPGGRTAESEPARRATLRVTLDAPAGGRGSAAPFERGPDCGGEPAPGRGRLACPDGRVTPFQGGRVTGRIPRTATLRPTVVPLEWHRMGDPPARRSVRELGNGPTDLALLASALERAAREVSAAKVPSLL
ncbi:FHA domain-containing protein [Streptomyces sp. NPDC046831]|uniref:FHA domain-containing protein n=1 Tax=Streptomyces sp. NPDC046831 TaxID=3154805 RepID=UPI0033C10A7C